MQAVLDEYFCYQQFNELLNQEGHTSPTGDSSPENGEVRVRLISGKYYQMKYTGGAWVDVAIRLPSGYYLNQDGSASKGLSFDASGNATFEQNVDVKGSLKIGGVAGALIPLGGVFLGMFVNATLPAGWTRYTAMDDRVPRGSATPGTDGGSATHEHSFTIDIWSGYESAHTHPVVTDGPTGTTTTDSVAGMSVPTHLHTHTGTANAGSAHRHSVYQAVTLAAMSNWAPYRTVVYATKD